MKSNPKDTSGGKMHQVKGKIKEAIGKIAGDCDLKIEGENENLDGKAQEERGRIEKVIGN